MKKTIPKPKCSSHADCHAYKNGECIALIDSNFGTGDCPFYKTRSEYLKDKISAAEKLKASGRIDLIEQYYTSVKLFEKMIKHDKAELHALTGD